MNISFKIFAWILISFIVFSCKKNNEQIPYVPVNFYLYTSSPQFNQLNAVGGWTYVNGGSKGIVIYHRLIDEFVAFDRHSTYNIDAGCQVSVDNSYITLTDSCSGSQFLLYDGSVAKGPASFPLKAYQTSYDGITLKVFN